MLKGIRRINDRFEIVPEGAGKSSGDFELFKILFKYVLVFN